MYENVVHISDAYTSKNDGSKKKRKTELYNGKKDIGFGTGSSEVVDIYEGKRLLQSYNRLKNILRIKWKQIMT